MTTNDKIVQNLKSYNLYYLITITICLIVCLVSAITTKYSDLNWYAHLIKPSFTPPSWLFGPVWLVLYLMMGIAWGKVNIINRWKSVYSKENIWFLIQIFLNVIWSYIYFGKHLVFYAWIDITLLWCATLITIYYFFKVSKFAGFLLIPYIIWLTYANLLNASILYLNN